jgi:hypothetical protein
MVKNHDDDEFIIWWGMIGAKCFDNFSFWKLFNMNPEKLDLLGLSRTTHRSFL